MNRSTESGDKPGILDRLRARMPWLDHAIRAQQRYSDCDGDFYAAAITYFTIFALFPLLMVGFSVGGFVLASQPQLLGQIKNQIEVTIGGDLGQQIIVLMDSAINSRASVGIIGLAAAAWAGLSWMNNLREALSQMWGSYREERPGFIRTKLSDLLRLVSAAVAILASVALTALGSTSLLKDTLSWLGVDDTSGMNVMLRVGSTVLSVLVSWLLFTWAIARLPRESVSFRSSVRAGLLAAVAFEIFKQLGSIYLSSVVASPAGATFGPVLGLMVFAYITARLILFSTAWAATTPENMGEDPIPAPGPVVIQNRIITRPGLRPWQAALAVGIGALGALSLSRWRRR
ncbi:MAG: inner membrane protein YhjD [Mycobacterium sp.]